MLPLLESVESSKIVVADRPTYRPYRARVAALRELSAHFTRVTFWSVDFETFGTAGLDQHIKIIMPLEGFGLNDLGREDTGTGHRAQWHERWRALPERQRNSFRTYTVRAVRPELCEVDIDFVVHADGGPASRWLAGVTPGDEVVIIGPDARCIGSRVGIHFAPGRAKRLLLVGDETATPAICNIVESLPDDVTAQVFIEVPDTGDALNVTVSPHCSITWIARGESSHGEKLETAVRAWAAANPTVIDEHAAFYVWIAGESGVIKKIRRFHVSETRIERSRVTFMGYWRHGTAEAQ